MKVLGLGLIIFLFKPNRLAASSPGLAETAYPGKCVVKT
jgi:hypothetical protein